MSKSKNILLYETIALLIVFTIGYFIVINKVSYAFTGDDNVALYDAQMSYITIAANNYTTNNIELFEEKDTIYLTVKDLLKEGYLPKDSSGDWDVTVKAISNVDKLKIKVSYKDKKIETKILT